MGTRESTPGYYASTSVCLSIELYTLRGGLSLTFLARRKLANPPFFVPSLFLLRLPRFSVRLLLSFYLLLFFLPASFLYALARARAVSLPFLGLSAILSPLLSLSPSPSLSRPLHLPRSRAPSLIVHFADTVKTRFILVTRHKAQTCQSVDDLVTPSIRSCKGDGPNELRHLLIKIIPLGSFCIGISLAFILAIACKK